MSALAARGADRGVRAGGELSPQEAEVAAAVRTGTSRVLESRLPEAGGDEVTLAFPVSGAMDSGAKSSGRSDWVLAPGCGVFQARRIGSVNGGQVLKTHIASVVKSDVSVAPCVSGLLSRSGPPAVVWRVIPVDVNSVYRVPCAWAGPHVGMEGGKRVSPPITYGYTAPAIGLEVRVLRVVAPLLHAAPRSVFTGTQTAMSMRGRPASCHFALKAAATLSDASPEAVQGYYAKPSTVASALPSAPRVHAPDGNKSSKPLISNIETPHA